MDVEVDTAQRCRVVNGGANFGKVANDAAVSCTRAHEPARFRFVAIVHSTRFPRITVPQVDKIQMPGERGGPEVSLGYSVTSTPQGIPCSRRPVVDRALFVHWRSPNPGLWTGRERLRRGIRHR